jgi:hypothetical protein
MSNTDDDWVPIKTIEDGKIRGLVNKKTKEAFIIGDNGSGYHVKDLPCKMPSIQMAKDFWNKLFERLK